MADVFTKAKRSEVMARIRSRGNRDTELALARLLRAHGITGWRRQVRVAVESSKLRVERKKRSTSPPARRRNAQRPTSNVDRSKSGVGRWKFSRPFTVTPDFVFFKPPVAVFVDGCFWHGCPKHATKPKNNAAFWQKKLKANKRRDELVTRTLRRAGWRVVRIWECALHRDPDRCRRRVQRAREQGGPQPVGRGS